jgi:replicative DNA helicase
MSNLDYCILKSIVSNKKIALDFANEFDAKLFVPEVWNFANIVLSYIKTYKDLPTLRVLTEKIQQEGNQKLIEIIIKIWKQLDTVIYDDKEFKHDLIKLKKRFAEQQILSIKESLIKCDPGNIDIKSTISNFQKTLQNIKSLDQVKAYNRKTLKDEVPEFRDEYNAKLQNPEFNTGIKTGYSYLDLVTDGLREGELLLIGGESGAGKSMLLMNIALQIYLGPNTIDTPPAEFTGGNSVLYFSLEMPFKPCRNRVLSRLSNCPSKKIRSATLDSDEAIKLKKALKFISKYNNQFEIVDIPRGATMESMELIFEEAKAMYNPKVVVIDYLGLMDYDGGKDLDDWLKLGKIAEKMHEFARVHNCVVLSAVQLNRSKGGKEEEKIGLHRVGRSALILQNANIAVQIESRSNEKEHPDMNYHVIKNRDGELGAGKLIKNLAYGTLIDCKCESYDVQLAEKEVYDISNKIDQLEL